MAPSLAPTDWEPVPDQPASSQTQLTDIVWTGARFVAAGTFNTSDPVFVDSTDGQTWNVQPSSDGRQVHGLAAGPAGVIAVGLQGSDARSWFSKDGLSLDAAPISRPSPAGGWKDDPDERRDLDRSGWLAVGEEDIACEIDCDSGVVGPGDRLELGRWPGLDPAAGGDARSPTRR